MAAFAGFDRSGFPSASKMAKLKANTNLVWCGFYLGPAPSHPDDGRMQQRATLVGQGWGIAPLYVGQQVIGKGSKNPSAAQGTTDAQDAVTLLGKAGFSGGTCVYLDLENGKPLPDKLADYVGTWVDGVAAKGFKPGVYCSHTIAAVVHNLRPAARIWAFNVPTTKPHAAAGPPFGTPAPSTSGFARAHIIQFDQRCTITVPGIGKLGVDLDSALTQDPGI
jgi:hypothetical protein